MAETYRIVFASSAAKEYRALPREIKDRIAEAVDALATTPRPIGARKLQGSTDLYRLREGEYRVVYEIDDDDQTITVTRIGHRRDVYR